MALTAYSSLLNSDTPIAVPHLSLNESRWNCSSPEISHSDTAKKTEQFFNGLQLIKKEIFFPDLRHLCEIISRMNTQEFRIIKHSLNKPHGYFWRLFSSNESWEEWFEYKTPLGKVILVFANFVDSKFYPVEYFLNRLDAQTVKAANEQAMRLLEELKHKNPVKPQKSSPNCFTGLAIGSIASFFTKNPLFLLPSAFNCIDPVEAHRKIDTAKANDPFSTVSRHDQILNHIDNIRINAGLPSLHTPNTPVSPTQQISSTDGCNYPVMTLVIRDKILEKAKELRDGSKILKYSQTNRLGPDSYDCSGFVTSMYAAAGLPFGNPNTAGILALARKGCPFKEVTPDEAEPGDLIVWMKGEGDNTYDHVAIYDGEQTVKGVKDDAVISTSSTASKENRNTIQEILIKYMLGKNKNNPIHVLKWSLQSKWCEL